MSIACDTLDQESKARSPDLMKTEAIDRLDTQHYRWSDCYAPATGVVTELVGPTGQRSSAVVVGVALLSRRATQIEREYSHPLKNELRTKYID